MVCARKDTKVAMEAAAANVEWLQDAMAVLLVLLVLDRFADYHNDSATAPVRETAAQALAFAAVAAPPPVRLQVLEQLINMQHCSVWEVRGALCTAMCTLRSAQFVPPAAHRV
jgi:hypothetical protein